MVELKSIEQLLYFMKNHIHLSRYDEKFIENISTINQVTTNQVVLLHSLISKYRRQFIKHDLYPEQLFDLPWNVKVVESSPKYTDGHIEITNDMIYFKCPFNRKFIDEFRKNYNNSFVFNNDTRRYEAPYNQYSLKILLSVASRFFNVVNLCPVTQKLLNDIKPYETVVYWQPTLLRLNERLYIVGMNSALNDALGNIELNTDLKTLAILASYGIVIDDSLYDKDKLSDYISANAILTAEQSNIKNVVAVLKELNCDMVYITGTGLLNVARKIVIEELIAENIPFSDLTSEVIDIYKNCQFPVIIKIRKNMNNDNEPCKVCKVINIVNSLPIEIK